MVSVAAVVRQESSGRTGRRRASVDLEEGVGSREGVGGVDLEACYDATKDVFREVEGRGKAVHGMMVFGGKRKKLGGRIWRRATPPPKMYLVRRSEGEGYTA